MLAVVYARVSREEQARHGYSLEAQEELCQEKARELGADRVEVYRDEGVTGEILERPGLQAALAAAKGGAAFFVVYDPDRLSRKLSHQLLLADMIEKAGCRLEFVTMDWQDTPEGRLFYSLRGAIAEYEKEKFKTRSRMGRLAKARRGLLPFNPRTYGYRYVEGGRYEVNEAQAAVYRRMAEMCIGGMSSGEIAKQLNEEGVPGPGGGPWRRQTVRGILKNPVYMGVLYVNRYNTEGHATARQRGEKARLKYRPREEWVGVPVPPLIDPERWELLQQALTARKRGKQGGKTYRYYLSGLLRCGICGGGLVGGYGVSSTKSARKVYRYYMCTRGWPSVHAERGYPGEPCPGNRHRADALEEAVWARVREWLEDPEALARDAKQDGATEIVEREAARVQKRLAQLERERERVFEAYRRGLVDMEMFERAVQDVGREKAVLEARLKELEEARRAAALAEQGVGTLRELAHQVAGRLDDLSWDEREKLIRMLVRRAVMTKDELVIEARVNASYSFEGRCDIGVKTFVKRAISLSRGDSMIRQETTPTALHPNPMHMVRACFPCPPALRKKRSRLKATRGR
ncbi:MAG: recombinase family protein [Bacillota bacterium]|nr:recombinase family protein [Bacillota bacterium]